MLQVYLWYLLPGFDWPDSMASNLLFLSMMIRPRAAMCSQYCRRFTITRGAADAVSEKRQTKNACGQIEIVGLK